ncbi:unnamed protein product [Cuscuta europaea]|uniref:Uncharacterized protein n=1 Tax=Cuscuta europaea TaxID=41803 RepID=A0A9P1ED01_CUSEU|nr:unnamed protein product [Cuscuta europaea]
MKDSKSLYTNAPNQFLFEFVIKIKVHVSNGKSSSPTVTVQPPTSPATTVTGHTCRHLHHLRCFRRHHRHLPPPSPGPPTNSLAAASNTVSPSITIWPMSPSTAATIPEHRRHRDNSDGIIMSLSWKIYGWE